MEPKGGLAIWKQPALEPAVFRAKTASAIVYFEKKGGISGGCGYGGFRLQSGFSFKQ
ncbi:TPA: hypothetical protein ACFP30_001086 [Neisseria oralis]|jgi:hypothetical protein